MILRRIDRMFWTLLGVGLAGVAWFAPQLGLDANNAWGPSRRLLLFVGVLAVALGWRRELLSLVRQAGRAVAGLGARLLEASGLVRFSTRLSLVWRSSRFSRSTRALAESWLAAWAALLARSRLLRGLLGTRPARVSLAAWLAFSLVALSYLWFVSVGTWTAWPGTSAYHDLQAEAFLRGHSYLLRDPEPELLALEDPYDPAARVSVPHLWDASLYEGRYYLYWGPVPALLLMPVKAVAGLKVGDDALVLLFSIGSLYWITRLLLRVWGDHFRRVPGWAVVGSVLVSGWVNPGPWMLNSPWVYESAIVGGQMFLFMGIYALYPFLALSAGGLAGLLWAGASFALAVATRASLAAAVGAVALVAVMSAYARRRDYASAWLGLRVAVFFLPLALGGLALAGYNQSRFGSPFEFGQRYQLTSLNLRQVGPRATSIRNVPPNLYNYLVSPARTLPVFPYVKPRWGGRFMSIFRIPVPEDYYARQITGLLLSAPFCLYGLVSVSRLWRRLRPRRKGTGTQSSKGLEDLSESSIWLEAALMGAALAGFVMVQFFVVASMRYLGDFLPATVCLASIGFWRGLAARTHAGNSSTGYSLLGIACMMWTMLAGLLLGITSYHARFEVYNPALFKVLTDLLTP